MGYYNELSLDLMEEAAEQASAYAFYARDDAVRAAAGSEDCQAYDRRMANEAEAQRYVVYHRAPDSPLTTPWTLELRGASFASYAQASRTLRKLGKVEGNGCHCCVFPLEQGATPPATLGAEEGLDILYRS